MSDGRATLDFIVWGVARSGTTSARNAVNDHPPAFCTNEWALALLEPDDLALPDRVLQPGNLRLDPGSRERDQALLAAKLAGGGVTLYGDKLPDYFVFLERVEKHHPRLRHFALYRTPLGFSQSWDFRAANPNDDWPTHKTGLLSLIDWVLCMDALASTSAEVHLLSYEALFRTDPDVFPRFLSEVIRAAPSGTTIDAFRKRDFRTRRADSDRVGSCPHRELLERLRAREVDAEVQAFGFGPASRLAPLLRRYVDDVALSVAEYVAAYPMTEEARRWAHGWLARRRSLYAESSRQSPAVQAALELLCNRTVD